MSSLNLVPQQSTPIYSEEASTLYTILCEYKKKLESEDVIRHGYVDWEAVSESLCQYSAKADGNVTYILQRAQDSTPLECNICGEVLLGTKVRELLSEMCEISGGTFQWETLEGDTYCDLKVIMGSVSVWFTVYE